MNKKKKISLIIFVISFFALAIVSLLNIKPVKTDLISGFLADNSVQNADLIKLSKLASNKINVTFETEDYDESEVLKTEFLQKVDKKAFTVENAEFSKILDLYKQNSHNFLTERTKNLIQNKDYKTLDNEALNGLYNPAGLIFETPDKDPYLLLTDYLNSFAGMKFAPADEVVNFDGKFYSTLTLSLNSGYSENEVGNLEKIRKELTKDSSQIYFTGALIHSYTTSSRSVVEINVICFVSILALVLLCKLYLKSLKILIPIGLSIGFGTLLGYLMTNLVFSSINVLTFVFSTTLIGVSLDYSLHYYLTDRSAEFYKSLTYSMLTTTLAFFALLISNVEVLREIAVFTGFGLIGVYLFVVLVLPMFNFEIDRNIKTPCFDLSKFKKIFLICVCAIFCLGLFRLNFNDDIKSLYTPPKNLLSAEKLYKEIYNLDDKSFILVKGDSFENLMSNEEKITNDLQKQNIPYISMSKIIPSANQQKENQKLVKTLYTDNLNEYANSFLGKNVIDNLKNSFNDDKIINPEIYKSDYLKNFMLDENTSFIIIPSNNKLDSKYNQIYVAKEISSIIKNCRISCQRILPVILAVIVGLLIFIYGGKKAFKIILSPLLGIIFVMGVISLFGKGLNIFHILALFLILGFSLDYSIFRASGDEKSCGAVLLSCASTVFSFFLLAMTSFTLISSLGIVLCIGILTSYVASLVILSQKR